MSEDIQVVKPYPIAEPKLCVKILELLQQSIHYKQLRKGANEVIKALNRGQVEVVIMAADTNPIEMLMNVPNLCEEKVFFLLKNVPYCYVPHNTTLGRACGIKRPVICACVLFKEGSQLNSQMLEIKDEIESLFI